MNTQSKRSIGRTGEDLAEKFLIQNGYTILEKNFYYQHGEIDIVAEEGNTLVFVEVKLRATRLLGDPEESVTPRKQEVLRRTAEGYVSVKNLGNIECRFDVVSILKNDKEAECKLLKNCF